VIFFHVVTSKEIYGAARLSLVNTNLTVHKLSEKAMFARQVRKHFETSFSHKPRYLDLYYDGEELPKDVAAVMKNLLF
jgi:glycogen debranching enzyme